MKKQEVKRMLEKLLWSGNQCAAICFNGKQSDSIPDHYKKSMSEANTYWDTSRAEVREWMKKEGL